MTTREGAPRTARPHGSRRGQRPGRARGRRRPPDRRGAAPGPGAVGRRGACRGVGRSSSWPRLPGRASRRWPRSCSTGRATSTSTSWASTASTTGRRTCASTTYAAATTSYRWRRSRVLPRPSTWPPWHAHLEQASTRDLRLARLRPGPPRRGAGGATRDGRRGPGRGHLAAPRRAGMGRPVGALGLQRLRRGRPALLRERLIDRKVRGGLDHDAAVAFYEHSDRLNVDRVLTRTDRTKVDLLLHLNPDGTTERRVSP